MTFLEPFLLWGLPLISLPIIIHLLNRRRHRQKKWAAMEFLLLANRSTTKISNFRHWLILLCRCLVILLLILALARPLAGSFLGWSANSVDTVFIVLDRSSSMGLTTQGAENNRLTKGVQNVIESVKSLSSQPNLIAIDSATGRFHTLASSDDLQDSLLFGATETGTDIPDLLNKVLLYLLDNKCGNSEIWIVSDLQKSNWLPESEAWKKVTAQYKGMEQSVVFKVLSLAGEAIDNSSIAVLEVTREKIEKGSVVQITFEIRQTLPIKKELQVSFHVDGLETTKEFTIDGQSSTFQHRISLSEKLNEQSGFGYVKIPADGNLNDNSFYFAYEPLSSLHSLLLAGEKKQETLLQVALAPNEQIFQQTCKAISLEKLSVEELTKSSLLVIDGVELDENSKKMILDFMNEGGVVVVFASKKNGNKLFNGIDLSEIENRQEPFFTITKWEENMGPFIKSVAGESFPLKHLKILKRQVVQGEAQALAFFDDGSPLLNRFNIGKGYLYYCATNIGEDWSNLANGSVLVPMLHRLQKEGAGRLSLIFKAVCGDLKIIKDSERRSETTEKNRLAGVVSGVYQRGDKLIVMNRPNSEDEKEVVEEVELKKIFGEISMNLQEGVQREDQKFKSKIWTPLLLSLFVIFLIEGWLTKRVKPEKDIAVNKGAW